MQMEGKGEDEKVIWKQTRNSCSNMEPQFSWEHPDRQMWQHIQEIKQNEIAP